MSPFLAVALLVLHGTVALKVPGPHLADISVLLPPRMTHPVEYRLQGIDGCFEWSWDDHDLLSVLPEYSSSNHCSTSARLRSIAPYNGRKETIVYASDVSTGIVTRCKVFIDSLSRIKIFHTSLELDLDEIAILRVRAFDKEGNVFTSLTGLQFMWELLPETGNHLVHVPLKDSPLSDSDVQINLEDNGVYSDLYLVKGIGIGHETVSVHLLEHHSKDMTNKIVLNVIESTSLHSRTYQRNQETTMLNLTPDDETSFITLVVNTDDQVHFDGLGSIKVSPIDKEDFGIGGRVELKIEHLISTWMPSPISSSVWVGFGVYSHVGYRVQPDIRWSWCVPEKHHLFRKGGLCPNIILHVKLLKPVRFREKTIITLTTSDKKVKVEANFEERHEPPSDSEVELFIRRLLLALAGGTPVLLIAMCLCPPRRSSSPNLPSET